MDGRVVVITGGTSGIGQVAAGKLAGMGARMVLVARDKERGQAALDCVRSAGPNARHSIHYADLSTIAEMKRVASEISAAEPRIDVLINNAGALFNSRRLTADGLEMTFATNHMSYYVLTLGLAERLKSTSGARVVNTASDAHKGARLDFGDLQSANNYRGFPAYSRSKLCNILFTRELSKRWSGTGMTVNCLHPGFVKTRFGNQSGGALAYGIRIAKMFAAISQEKGSRTIVYLASSDEVSKTSGAYFYKCKPVEPTQEAQDDESARRLWEESAKLM